MSDTDLLKNCGIEPIELKYTKDYWARDYMPIQLNENEFLKYQYYPDYLMKSNNPEDAETRTECTNVLRGMGINCRSTKLIIDGGNMVPCGPCIVMTDKVFIENGKEKEDAVFKAELESEFGHPVIIIPWEMCGDFNACDTDKSIFNIKEDVIAWQYIHEAFPDCEIHQIEMAEVAEEGGALHCIS